MGKVIVIWILSILVFSSNVFAKEYRFNKECNPFILVEELREAGIVLEGEDQVGSLNVVGNEIVIITKKNIDRNKLSEVIENHKYKLPTQVEIERRIEEERIKEVNRESGKGKLKELGLTDEEIEALFE